MEAVLAGFSEPKYLTFEQDKSLFRIKKVAWNCDFFEESNREHLMTIKKLCEGQHECNFLANHETFGPDLRRCSHKAESEYSLQLVFSCPGRDKRNHRIDKNKYTCVIPTTTTTTTTTTMMMKAGWNG